MTTVVFADLVGSTELASSLDPELVRDMLDRFYDSMTAEITAAGGTVEKFIGDAVVAVFGAPAALEDHAQRACDVALSMQRCVKELFDGRLSMRVGVNSGEVVVGRSREGSSFASGDTVNVAARLEQAARAGQVLASERTVAAVRGLFDFGEAIVVAAKGKSDGVKCRELTGKVRGRPAGVVRGPHVTFVGRERELHRLSEQLNACIADSAPRFVLLSGEPGVGKSSVVSRFQVALPPDVSLLVGRCRSYGRNVTYSPLGEVLRTKFGVTGEEPTDLLNANLPGGEDLRLTFGVSGAADIDPRAFAEQLRVAWVRLLSDLAAVEPVVLVVEDLHWASAPLATLIHRLLTDVAGPLLILGTTRPDEFEPADDAGTIYLQPLSPRDVELMVDQLLDADVVGPVVALIGERADGNPFFVEEIVATLIDTGLLERVDGRWVFHATVETPAIPDSVLALLAARIDMLTPTDKSALLTGSVIGREFHRTAIDSLVDPCSYDLGNLIGRGFVYPDGDRLVFKHALTQEVAYGMLPKARRAHVHAAYANWVEDTVTADDARAATLAHHLAEAVDPDIAELAWRGRDDELQRLRARALQWLRLAADLAVRSYDTDYALRLLHQADRLDPANAQRWHVIGRANAMKFDGERFWEAMLHAISLTKERLMLAELYSELAFESQLKGAMWKRAPDQALLGEWLQQALELAPPDSQVDARARIALAMRDDDRHAAEVALDIAERHDDVELASYALFTLWTIVNGTSDYVQAQHLAQRRAELIDRFTDPDHLGHIQQASSAAALAVGQLETATQHAQALDAVIGRLTPHHAIHAVGTLLGVAEAAGDWEQISRLQPRAEQAVSENSDTPCAYNARVLMSCALSCGELGLADEARRLEDATDRLDLESYRTWFDPLRARLALLRGDLTRVNTLLATAEQWPWPSYVHVQGVTARLDALVAVGRFREAEIEAIRLVQPGTYLEPFALRTLSKVRRQPDLQMQAVTRFESMHLFWHADQTRINLHAAPAPR